MRASTTCYIQGKPVAIIGGYCAPLVSRFGEGLPVKVGEKGVKNPIGERPAWLIGWQFSRDAGRLTQMGC